MASNGVTIEAKLDEKGVVTGAKKVTASLDEIKRADGNLKWDGLKNGEQVAKSSGDGFTVLKGILANLASQGIMMVTQAMKDLAVQTVQTGMSFESSMSQVAATLGMTTDDISNNVDGAGDRFNALRQKAQEMGAATVFSASEAADGLNILAMSGYSAEESIAMVEDVLHLAAAGSMDMASAAGYISGAMKGFNDETKTSGYYADLMAKGATLANTSVSQLGDAMSSGAATAAAYGQSADNMTISLLRLAEQGVTGSAAGTALAAAMKNLYTPTDQAKKALEELGVAAYDESGKAREFNEVVNELNGALAGMSEEEANAYKQTIFGIQGLDAYNKMVVTGTEKQVEWAESLAGASDGIGEAAKQYDTMTDNLEGDLAGLNSAFEGVQVAIYDGISPALRELAQMGTQALSDLIPFINSNVIPAAEWVLHNLPTVGTIIAGLTAAIIAFKTGVTGAEIATKAWGLVTKAQTALQAALNAVLNANPIGIVILAITALVAAFVYLWNNCEEFREFWIGVWEAVMAAVQPIADWVMQNVIGPLAEGFEQFKADFSGIWDAIVSKLQAAWNVMMPLVQGAFAFIQGVFNTVMPVLESFWNATWNTISTVLRNVWNIMRGIVESVMGVIQGVIKTVTALIRGDWQGVWNGIAQIFQSILQGIFNTAANIFNAISSTISSVLSGIYSVWSSIWKSVSSVASSVWNGIKSTIGGIINGISSNISGVFNGLLGTVTGIWNGIKNAITNPIETAKGIVDSAISTISGIITGANLKLPEIKLPHFNINGGELPWGIGGKGHAPSISIDWYAKGGIFDTAQIIGIGEAGREAALPLNRQVYDEIAQGINRQLGGQGGGIDYERLGAEVARALVRAGFGTTVIQLDGKQIAMAIAGNLDAINGARYSNAVRGLAQ
ncbi:MAG: phage tail tape measure protein [Eggerthellaceae bacterium]|nr:phage tail tape measure protein [Eggerthellaceae bacterium]